MMAMKTFSVLVLGLGLAFVSCKKEDPVVETPTGGGGGGVAAKSFSADIDGAQWQATSLEATIENGEMHIVGENSSGTFDLIVLQEGEGSYWSPSSVCTMQYTVGTSTEDVEGVLKISAIDNGNKRISGTFSGVTSGGVQITSGVFTSIPYTGVYTGAGVPLTQSGDANLDGAGFGPDILTGNQGFGRIAVNLARGSDNYTIGLNVVDNIEAGDYTLQSSGDYKGTFATSGALDDQYVANNGSLRIIGHNTQNGYLMGEFSFTAVPSAGSNSTSTYSINNGSFGMNY